MIGPKPGRARRGRALGRRDHVVITALVRADDEAGHIVRTFLKAGAAEGAEIRRRAAAQ